MDDRAFASATELSDEIRDRHIGCVELLDFYLARGTAWSTEIDLRRKTHYWSEGDSLERRKFELPVPEGGRTAVTGSTKARFRAVAE